MNAIRGPSADMLDPVKLFNGRDLDEWTVYPSDLSGKDQTAFAAVDGMLRIAGGKGDQAHMGWIFTKDSFRNYRLSLHYKWGGPAYGARKESARSSAVLLHASISSSASGSPTAIQVKLMEGNSGTVELMSGLAADDQGRPIKPGVTAEAVQTDSQLSFAAGAPKMRIEESNKPVAWNNRDQAFKDVLGFRGRDDVESPLGQWTRLDWICRGDNIEIYLNGQLVNRLSEVSPSSGRVGLQSSGAEIWFRNIELVPLP
ncbi:MAG: DUF1080 domain-containing protein [Verrucomicrobiota bacterium]